MSIDAIPSRDVICMNLKRCELEIYFLKSLFKDYRFSRLVNGQLNLTQSVCRFELLFPICFKLCNNLN